MESSSASKRPAAAGTATMESSSNVHARPSRKIRRRLAHDQQFANYLPFGYHTTICLAIFFVAYATVLLCLVPLLRTTPTFSGATSDGNDGKKLLRTYSEHHGDALKQAFDPLMETYKHLPGHILAEELAGAVKKRIADFRQKEGYSDASLLKQAAADIHGIRQQRSSTGTEDEISSSFVATSKAASGNRTGFMVLGMHRSGTGILGGLLVEGMGYFGGPKMGSDSDNEKGSFERLDVVLQNDLFMNSQRVWWSINVREYDSERAWHDHKLGKVGFRKGENALKFFNDPDHAPWYQKDPRMCITLKTWLPLLHNEPAVLFTYRHPLHVARSLLKREKGFRMDHAFRVWIVYNMRAIQNSEGLCRVLTSNEAVLADPMTEVQRIANELTTKCGVPEPPRELTQEDVDKFVDPSLNTESEKSSDGKQAKTHYTVVHDYGNDCVANDYLAEFEEEAQPFEYTRERDLYLKAMQVYCDLRTGEAFNEGYEWPELT
jgi:hypothetical protein